MKIHKGQHKNELKGSLKITHKFKLRSVAVYTIYLEVSSSSIRI